MADSENRNSKSTSARSGIDLISEEKKLLQKQLQLFFEHTPDSVCIKDDNLVHIYANPVLLEKIGCRSLQEFAGTNVHDWVEAEAADAVDQLEYKLLEQNQPVSGLIPYTLKNGHQGYQQSRKFIFYDVAGNKYFATIDTEMGELFNEKERASNALRSILKVLEKTAGLHDPFTQGHESRGAHIAEAIVREMGLSDSQIDCVKLAASVHDVGKIKVPSDILNRTGPISETEYALVKEHADIGYQIIKDIEFDYPIADVVRQHHERLDGRVDD